MTRAPADVLREVEHALVEAKEHTPPTLTHECETALKVLRALRSVEGWAGQPSIADPWKWEFAEDDGLFTPGQFSKPALLLLTTPQTEDAG